MSAGAATSKTKEQMTATSLVDPPDESAPRRRWPRRWRRRGGHRPLGVLSALTVLIAVAAVAALVFGLIVVVRGATRPVPGLTPAQQQAVSAAKQESVNLQTFRRSQFEKDFNNALAGLTNQFKQQLISKKAALQQALTTNKIDSIATVSSGALVSSTATGAVVLVTVSTSRLNDAGQSSPAQFSRLQLTMKLVGGKWLVDNLASVGLS